MKFIQGRLGWALAVGLLAFAAVRVQASDVIDNVIYAPLSLKATATYVFNSHNVKLQITTKLLLEILGLPKGAKLMVNTQTGDVWAFAKDESEDLTADGYLTISMLVASSTSKSGTLTEAGSIEVDVYQFPQFEGELDQAASEAASDNWFELNGTYTFQQTEGAVNSKGLYKVSSAFKAAELTGQGFFVEVTSDIKPMTGSATAKGSGSLENL